MPHKIAFIRGQYLNNFELQSYYPLKNHPDLQLTGITSLMPMHHVSIPTIKLASPVDLPNFPYKFPILNRLFIDAMYLHGLEKELMNFDIAHACETFFHFSFQAAVARKRNYVKKLLVTCYEPIANNHETIWGRKAMKKYVKASADHFHCVTNRARQCLIDEGVDASKISVIHYGIDLKRFQPINHPGKTHRKNFEHPSSQNARGITLPSNKRNNSSKRDSNHPINLLFVGRLEAQKGISELLEAYQQLKKSYSNIELKVVGKGPMQKQLNAAGIPTDTYSYDQMPSIFNQADILVHPPKRDRYWEESFGMVLLEAMASFLPIVTTNNGAIPEVVGANTHKPGAEVVEQGNAKALYQGIKKLIDHPNLAEALAQKGYKRAQQHFDSQKQSEKLAELYLKLANSS